MCNNLGTAVGYSCIKLMILKSNDYIPKIFSTYFAWKSLSLCMNSFNMPLDIWGSWKWLFTNVAFVFWILMICFVVYKKSRLTFVRFWTKRTFVRMVFKNWSRFHFSRFWLFTWNWTKSKIFFTLAHSYVFLQAIERRKNVLD